MNAQKAFDKIPVKAYGEIQAPELDDIKRSDFCPIIAKRALHAAYREENDPETRIVDLLADLRHLCDRLRLDFGDLDGQAHYHYLEDLADDRHK